MMLFLLACAPGTAPACDTGYEVTWEGWAEGFFLSYCTSCHSEAAVDRHGATPGVDFDTEAQARALADRVRETVLVEETMPWGGGMREDDKVLIERWLDCGE